MANGLHFRQAIDHGLFYIVPKRNLIAALERQNWRVQAECKIMFSRFNSL